MSATYNGEGLKWISFLNKLEGETRSEIPSEAFFFGYRIVINLNSLIV